MHDGGGVFTFGGSLFIVHGSLWHLNTLLELSYEL